MYVNPFSTCSNTRLSLQKGTAGDWHFGLFPEPLLDIEIRAIISVRKMLRRSHYVRRIRFLEGATTPKKYPP
jgi:hypothetical protein